ncbi:MAG: hypothetical protein KDC48_14470 [Planctomycetes bacterium]|nr:hypothetical protein [Planctomycetota bacterium]
MSLMPRPAARLVAVVLLVILLAGAVLTGVGLAGLDPARSGMASHIRLFAKAGGLVLLVVLVAARWHRLSALSAGALLAAAGAAAAGQFGALLAVLSLGVASVAAGRWVLGRRGELATDLDCLLVGLTLYGTLIGLLVHLPVNYPGVYVALLALPVWRRWSDVLALVGRVRERLAAPRTGGGAALLLSAAIAAIGLVHLVVALMPERGHDALVTHLLLPARIAWDHVWAFDVDTYVWAVMPLLGDWLYTIGYVLGGEAGARLVNLGCIFVLCRLVFDVTLWIGGGRDGALWAVLLLLVTPLTLRESSTLFIESVWSCLVVGGALALLRLLAEPAQAPLQLRLGGVLLGGALATKAVTFVTLPGLALLLVVGWRRWIGNGLRSGLLWGGVAFLAIGSLPYVRAYAMTGNPVFPFFNGVFRSPHYPPENFSPPAIFEKGMTWDVLHRITFESPKFLEAYPGAAGFQWLLLVAPALVVFVLVWHRRALAVIFVAAAAAYLCFRQTAYLRYVFPSFALFSAVVGVLIDGLLPRRRAASIAVLVAALTAVALNLRYFTTAGFNHQYDFKVLTSDAARQDYLAQTLPLRSAVALVNELNVSSSPVAFFSAAMATGLHADGLFPNWYNHKFQSAVTQARTGEALGAMLAGRQVRYLVLADSWSDAAARARVREVGREVRRIGDVSVLELDPRFRYQTEMLTSPDLSAAAATSAEGWRVDDGVAVAAGVGATLADAAGVSQRVPVTAGREYLLTATARPAAGPAKARLRVLWLDARNRWVNQWIETFDCVDGPVTHRMEVVAPPGAVVAEVFTYGLGAAPVIVSAMSFRN